MFLREILALSVLLWAQAALGAGPDASIRPLARGGLISNNAGSAIGTFAARLGDGASGSAVLVDVASGKVLEAYQADAPMPPASVIKVVTTLYGMDVLGADYSFKTRVMIDGPVRDGMVQGNMTLVGSGDPVLDSDELMELVEQLSSEGIFGISGKFRYYDGALPYLREIDREQPVEAVYNPSISGLNLNFNRVHVRWDGDAPLQLTARAERYAPEIDTVRVERDARDGPVYRYKERQGVDHWSILSSAMTRTGAVWLPVRTPSQYAAEVFRRLARSKDIYLPPADVERDKPSGQVVAEFQRRPLNLLARGMLHFSTNLTAEVIGLTASGKTQLTSSGQAMQDWAKTRYGVEGRFHDHSGLGDSSRISANAMATVIAAAGRTDVLDGLLRRYYVQDSSGKKSALNGADIRAKTGTLNFVRGLAGLITVSNGRELAFAIFSADLERRARADKSRARPRGARGFANRSVGFEQAVLRRWLNAYAK